MAHVTTRAFADERRAAIMEMLEHNASVQVAEIAQTFGVSSVTARADLDALADTPEVKARRIVVAAFEARMTELSKTACYTMRQLAVNGGDLMEAGLPAGPAVGATLQRLLTAVMEGRVLNERAALLEFALS